MQTQPLNQIDILIVDDDVINLKLAERILGEEYSIITARSGEKALDLLTEYCPKLILLDLHMPDMDGETTMSKMQQNKEWAKIPVIFLTSDSAPETEQKCFDIGAADFVVKPFVPIIMKSRISRTIEFYSMKNNLEDRLNEKSRIIETVSLNSIMAIANTIDAKDAYTAGHSRRVAKCSEEIAKKLGWDEKEVQNIYRIGLLHDIGKIGVPDSVLNKPTKLNDEEFALIKKHPVIGGEILKDIKTIPGVSDGARYHHERYDGKGYPSGLKGEDIPLCARIIAIADAYDAMTSNRIYRAKLPDMKVVNEFDRCKGTQFDPEIADVFVGMLKDGFFIENEHRRKNENVRGEDAPDWASESSALLNKVLLDYNEGKGSVDFLTGLNNRGYGEAKIGKLLMEGHKGAMLAIDLDNFKMINDTYGHLMGDKVLKVLAATLSSDISDKDVVCRLGGDEFAMFLTDTVEREKVEEHVKNIMHNFSENMADIECGTGIYLSIGIALSPLDGKDFSMLYNNADKALYYVKKSGKNSYSFFRDAYTGKLKNRPNADLDHIRYVLEGRMDNTSGAFKIQYEDFSNLYNYLARCVKRKGQMVQTLLFTFGNEGREYLDNAVYEEAMEALEVAIAYSLRMVDVGSRYSSVQYIVILVDTNIENGRKVAERAINQFYKIYSGSGIALSYDIQTMTINNQ